MSATQQQGFRAASRINDDKNRWVCNSKVRCSRGSRSYTLYMQIFPADVGSGAPDNYRENESTVGCSFRPTWRRSYGIIFREAQAAIYNTKCGSKLV